MPLVDGIDHSLRSGFVLLFELGLAFAFLVHLIEHSVKMSNLPLYLVLSLFLSSDLFRLLIL